MATSGTRNGQRAETAFSRSKPISAWRPRSARLFGSPCRSTQERCACGPTVTWLSRTCIPCGDLQSTTDPAGNTIRIDYDLHGRKVRLNDPDLGTWTLSNSATGRVYWRADQTDEQGHLTQQTYANGVATARSWDQMGRLVSSAAGTGHAVHNDSYGYDHLGNLRRRTDTRAGVILTHEYDYDNLKRLKTEARSGGGVGCASNCG